MPLITPAMAQVDLVPDVAPVFVREGIFGVLLFFAIVAIVWLVRELRNSEAGRREDLERFSKEKDELAKKLEDYTSRLASMLIDNTKADLENASVSKTQTDAIKEIGNQVMILKGAISALIGRGV